MSLPRSNMKRHSIAVLGLLVLCSLQEAPAFPKYASATTDWTQFFPAQKRAASSDGEDVASVIPKELPSQQLTPKLAPNPMSPFLALRPFLPVKPTFMPPLVDPQIFIDRKAALLNNLFGSSGAVTKSASTTTAAQPAVWLPAASPNYFADKKTQFLNTLFSNLAAQKAVPAGPQEVKRDLFTPGQVPVQLKQFPDSSVSATGSVTKNDFLEKLFAAWSDDDTAEENPVTTKPTIVPPSFWVPPIATAASLARVPLKKTPPVVVDPNFFIDKKTKFLNTLFSNLAVAPKTVGAIPTKPSIVPPNYWVPPGKPDTATIYQQKVSEFLDKLLKSLNVSSNPVGIKTTDNDSSVSKEGTEQEDVQTASVTPRFIGSPMGMWGGPSPFAPAVSPKFFIDKKNEFLDKLFTSLSTPTTSESVDLMADPSAYVKPTIVPANFWSPFPSGSADTVDSSTAVKPTIVPPNFWSPFAPTIAEQGIKSVLYSSAEKPGSAGDPSVFINNKAQFLDNLFNSLGLPPKSDAITPMETQTTGSTVIATAANTSDNNNAILADLLERLILSAEQADSISKRNNEHERENTGPKDISSEEVPDNTDYLSKRAISGSMNAENPGLSASPLLVAKDKVVNSIISELGGIKNEMMTTVDEILKQKKEIAEQAAAANPFSSFGMKSPYAFGGGKMFGAGMKGTSKKGDTAAADGKKKVSPPFGGKFPFWAPTPETKPTPDPTAPLQERLEFLNQVFEMLTKLQEDVSSAVNEAASESVLHTTPSPIDSDDVFNIMKKIMSQKRNSTKTGKGKLSTRELESNPESLHLTSIPLPTHIAEENKDDALTRSIKMAVHQGYQSLPPGTEEMIETGGGSEVDNHEGGGLKLQIKVPV